VGKSTLLNALLNEERAIVSAIAGTTRDTIEDELVIEGVGFRFIDTAGIRQTTDEVESIGIQKTFEKIDQAQVVLYLLESFKFIPLSLHQSAYASSQVSGLAYLAEIEKLMQDYPNKQVVVVINKIDLITPTQIQEILQQLASIAVSPILLSAKNKQGVEELKNQLTSLVNTGALRNNETIVTNTRHYDALLKALDEIQKVQYGIQTHLSSDLLAIDIREALYQFGLITGQVSNDELLGNIFANFCIGK
jgi:tRNA modification GTPase